MNMRNLLFLIVLFLVWLMGYHYYSPDRFPVDRGQQQETRQINRIANLMDKEESSKNSAQYFVDHQPSDVTYSENNASNQSAEESVIASVAAEPVIPPNTIIATEPEAQSSKHPKGLSKKKHKKQKVAAKKIKKIAAGKDNTIQETMTTPENPTISLDTRNIRPNQSTNNAAQDLMIPIKSLLVKKDIGYYKMLSWHYPYFFQLTVDGKTLFIKQDKKTTSFDDILVPADQPFTIRYSYEWHTPWGKRVGAKKVTFKAHPDAQNLSVRFTSNWKDEERIVIDGADKISAELLEEIAE